MPKKIKVNDNCERKVDRSNYGSQHKKLRTLLMQRYPICQICNKEFSQEAAHLIYPANDIEDYIALCRKCHKEFDGR